jgi:hypothetical protein
MRRSDLGNLDVVTELLLQREIYLKKPGKKVWGSKRPAPAGSGGQGIAAPCRI